MNVIFWKFLKNESVLAQNVHKNLKLGKLISLILAARFQTMEKIKNYLSKTPLKSAFEMTDMKKTVTRLKKAISNGEKIAIYGDYDCDGICASSMLFSYLKQKGALVLCYIPQRNEGYGLNTQVIEKFKQENVNIIVTVDNGITAIEEAKLIKKLNMELIITDHHNVSNELPTAFSILNPKCANSGASFKELCGAGVVLKLIAAMENDNFEIAFKLFGDLAAIATVADLVPLNYENKTIVLKGLKILQSTTNIGLKELLKLTFKNKSFNLNSTDLAFKICPTLNATGRIKTANLAFELLTCNNKTIAKQKAIELIETNSLRKQLQIQLFNLVDVFLSQNLNCLNQPVLIVYGNNWAKGLIGLIAGNLVMKFKKPTVVLSISNDVATGSARSFDTFNMYDALNFCKNLFIKWGGHNLAGGLTLKTKNIKIFIDKINQYAKTKKFVFIQQVDLITNLNMLTLNEVKQLKLLEPFGKFNEPPVLALKNLILSKIIPLTQGKHLRLIFTNQSQQNVNLLAFNQEINKFHFKTGEHFDILFQIDVSSYLGKETLNFKLVDLRPSNFNQKNLVQSFNLLQQLQLNQNSSLAIVSSFKPTKNDLKLIYLKLKQIKCFYGTFFELFLLLCDKISYFKFKIAINILIKLELVNFNGTCFKLTPIKNKINLNNSFNLKNLSY